MVMGHDEHTEAELERHRRANLLRAVLNGYGPQDEFINAAINAQEFDRVPWLITERLVQERRADAEHTEAERTLHYAVQNVVAAACEWRDARDTWQMVESADGLRAAVDSYRAAAEAVVS